MTDTEKFEDMIKKAQIYSDGSIEIKTPQKEEVVRTSSTTFQRKDRRNEGDKKSKKNFKNRESVKNIGRNFQMKELKEQEFHEIENYQEPTEDVETKNGWRVFKVGLALTILSAALVAGKTAYDKVGELLSNESQEVSDNVTLEIANDAELELAQKRVNSIKEISGYEFENLTNKELLDAVFRIVDVESDMHITTYRSHFITQGKDQLLLEKILKKTYGEEEYATFSPEKIRDLKKMAYELLSEDKEKQDCIRDPEKVRAAEEKHNNRNTEREIGE